MKAVHDAVAADKKKTLSAARPEAPVLPPPEPLRGETWEKKIRRAKEAREAALKLREGKPSGPALRRHLGAR